MATTIMIAVRLARLFALPLSLLAVVSSIGPESRPWQGKLVILKAPGITPQHKLDQDIVEKNPASWLELDDTDPMYRERLGHVAYWVIDERDGKIRLWPSDTELWVPRSEMVLLEDAVSFFTEQIRDHPNGAWCYYRRGLAHWLNEEWKQALEDLNEAIERDPDDAATIATRGHVRLEQEAYDQAIADFDEAIRLAPIPVVTDKTLILFDWGMARPESVKIRIESVSYLAPALLGRGYARFMKGEHQRAIQDFDEVIRLKPAWAEGYLERGWAWHALKEYDKARSDYDNVLLLDPDLLYPDLVSANVSLPLTHNSRSSNVHLNRGCVEAKLHDFSSALCDYDEAIRMDPRCVPAINEKAWLLATCRDDRFRNGPEAVKLATQVCELTDWKDAGCLGTLAAAYARIWDFELALKWQRAALEDEQYAKWEGANARNRIALYEAGDEYTEP